ncbi:MAG: YgaP family membrane protein [Coriobacteriia bacterium]
MNPFCTFMASTAGRLIRVVGGLALIAWGLWGLGPVAGFVVALIGIVPLAAGLFDFCVFAPLFGCPMSGPKIRGEKDVITNVTVHR